MAWRLTRRRRREFLIYAQGADKITDAVRAYGVVVIKGQNLTRAEQVKFTGLLGEPVALAKSFYGKDPEPNQPSILRVTNFWANGTWKGTSHKFGDYWHQDGQFWDAPKHNMLSIVHAQQVPPRGGETGFVDMRAARATLSAPLCVEIKFTARSHGTSAATSLPRNDLVKNYRVHLMHWLIRAQAQSPAAGNWP